MSTLGSIGITVIPPDQTAVRKKDVILPMELVSGVHLDVLDHSVIQVSKQYKTVLYVHVGVCLLRLKPHNYMIFSDQKVVQPLNQLNVSQMSGKMDELENFAISHI